jgi:hypothetical protein
MCLQPKLASRNSRGNSCLLPPSGFVAAAVKFAMMTAAEWEGELIADLTPQCAALGKAQVMGIARRTAAYQARLFGDEPDVLTIANAPRLGEGKDSFVYCL